MRAAIAIGITVGLLCLTAALAAGQELVLDDFDYGEATAASAAWLAQDGSPPVQIEHADGRTALKLPCNFSANTRRVVYDRQVTLDLSRWTRFSLDVQVPNPTAASQFTIYFRSGAGWYGRSFSARTTRWETVEFSRAEFRTEGTPDGWHAISGMRLAVWPGALVDAYAMVDSLKAYRDSIVLLIDPKAGTSEPEGRAALQYATAMADMLRRAGVRTGALTEADLLAGDLPDFEVIILPYNPYATEQAGRRLARYVEAGGKVLAFFALPPVLAEALGVRLTDFQRRDYDGQFARISLDQQAAAGMPESVVQHSWNIRVAEPVGRGARVVGRWLDADGRDTGYPALLMSDTGVYMSHVLIAEDVTTKTRMLLALLARFAPQVWEMAGRAAAATPAQVGHVGGEQVMVWLRDSYAAPGASAEGRALMQEAEALTAQTQAAVEAEDWIVAMELSAQRNLRLQQAYASALTSRQGEFRAVWEHSGRGGYRDDWDRTMRVLGESGFNAIFPNSFWGGGALYQSELLPVSPVVAERGDQIAAAVEAGRRHGIEVHPWKVNFRLARDCPQSFIDQMRSEGRLQVSITGQEGDWLCPSHPDNQELEIASMVEVASNYDVAGVHFDYIRYPDSAHCYCTGCRERFEAAEGLRVANWPDDLRSDELQDRWLAWRAAQITHIVRATTRRVHAARPECRVSAAVFSDYPNCYQGVGQDWVTWALEGYVDFLCPMNYTESDFAFAARTARQLTQVQGAVPVYPGIGASSSSSTLTADRVAGQIAVARNLGTDGFIIFNYTPTLGDTVLPDLSLGITQEQTYVPHYGPRFDFSIEGEPMAQIPGFRLQAGAPVSCTVRPAAGQPNPTIIAFSGTVALETADGQVVRQLGSVSSVSPELTVQIAAPTAGAYAVVIRGRAEFAEHDPRQFVARSVPLFAGDLSPELAALTGAD